MIKQIIALTGPIRAGKSSVLKLLEEKGYRGYKFSDLINKEIEKRGEKIQRRLQQEVGNEFRKRFGGNYWAKEILKIAKKDKSKYIVVDGIRNPDEIKYLKDRGAFIIGINADYETRKKRYLTNLKISDPKSKKEFDRIEKKDRGIKEEYFGQQVSESLKLADVVIINNWDNLDLLRKDIMDLLKKIKSAN